MCYQEILAKIVVLCHTARSILNRCERVALLHKDLWVLIKRRSLIGVDSRLCVSGNGKVWWEVIFMATEYNFAEKREFGENLCFYRQKIVF